MKLPLRNRRWLAVCGALVCGGIVLPATGLVASAASGAPASVTRCSGASTEVWAATEGDGTAGTIFYELEFSNIGHQTCTLRGYPDVWAITLAGHELGKPAPAQGRPGNGHASARRDGPCHSRGCGHRRFVLGPGRVGGRARGRSPRPGCSHGGG